eukprot:1354814-Amorphochlora_amoeboformis.AAC.3
MPWPLRCNTSSVPPLAVGKGGSLTWRTRHTFWCADLYGCCTSKESVDGLGDLGLDGADCLEGWR